MSADGSTYTDVPSRQFVTGNVYYQPPIFEANVTNAAIDSNNFVTGDVFVKNWSAGDGTDFQIKVDTYWTNSDGTNDSQLGSWNDFATLDNGASTTSTGYALGQCGPGTTTNRRVVVSMRAGTSGTSYVIYDHTFPD